MGNKIPTYSSQPKHDNEARGAPYKELYDDLVAMGFNKEHALDAAQKFPDSFNEAIDWIQSKEAITNIMNKQTANPRNDALEYDTPNDGYSAENEDEEDHEDDMTPIQMHRLDEQTNATNTNHVQPPLVTTNNNEMSETLQTADIIIKGEYNMDASDECMIVISDMIQAVLLNDNSGQYPNADIQSFLVWTNTIKEVKLNSFYYEDICNQLLMDDKRVKNLYAFDEINEVFKDVEQITAYHTGWISLYYLELLLDVLNRIQTLEYSKLNKICLNDINNIGSLNEFEKYQAVFKQKNWNIEQG
eukprot:98299_1